MSTFVEHTSAAPTKNLGQWALGNTEPLNANEEMKLADDGLNVRHRVETIYARDGFASIPADDLRGRLRWWGLYTQRKPGIDGGRTASLEPEELEDEHFLMRVRIDGGRLSLEQLRTVGSLSTRFARGTADVTDRQNVQYHWIRIEDVPQIWRELEAVGLSTAEACGDVPRVVLGSPVAGVSPDEVVDATWAIEEIQRRYLLDPAFSNLPRKFKSAVSGLPDVAHAVNDLSFVGVRHPEFGAGFDVWVGGGLSTNPHLAKRLGVWVPLEDVPEVWAAVVSVFRDYGYRKMRTKARLKFLVSDWGVERFRDVLETEYLYRPLLDGPAVEQSELVSLDHVGIHAQRDGRVYVGAAPVVGRVGGQALLALADLAEQAGADRVAFTVEQKVVILNVDPERVDALVEGLRGIGLEAGEVSSFRRGTMACTGVEFCKLAIVETKGRAADLVSELEARLPSYRLPLAVHVNGCPNSCARIQVADIGLKGIRALDDDGNDVEGFQVHVGGRLGDEAAFGRTVKGLRLPADTLPDYVETLVARFDEDREGQESFSAWAVRIDNERLLP